MAQLPALEITDKDGWRKAHPLQKRLVHIGSAAQNDIVLESWRGTGVAPRHLQLIALPAGPAAFRLINLADADVALGAAGERTLAPRASADIGPGEHIRLGDFALVLGFVVSRPVGEPNGGGDTQLAPPAAVSGAASTQASSTAIGLELFLPYTQLGPERPIEGAVIVRNLGNKPAVQFKLAVEGLPTACYEMGAGPLLFPNAEKEIYLRLRHPQGPALPAGEHRFQVHAKAPEAYPGEHATVAQSIHVLPFYKHRVRLVTPEK